MLFRRRLQACGGSGTCWLRTDLVAAGATLRATPAVRPSRRARLCGRWWGCGQVGAVILAEPVDGGAVAGAEHDVPEAIWPVEVVLACGGHDVRNGGAGEQARKCGGGGDRIPGVERPDQRRLDLTNR